MGNCQDNRRAELIYAVSTNNSDKKSNETHIFRHPESLGKDLYAPCEFRTLHDVYARRLKLEPAHNTLGRRERDAQGQLAQTITWYSNTYVLNEAEALGSGILNLGLVAPIKEWRNMPFLFAGVYSKNSLEYILFDIGCAMYGVTLVPIYDTLGEDATIFAFNQTRMTLCALTANHVEKMVAQQKANGTFPHLRHLIVFDFENLSPGLRETQEVAGIKLWPFEKVKDAGRKNIRAWAPVTPDSIYAFSYTSGTTGEPKGAMISHGNITSIFHRSTGR